jgi:hypothetical protein
MPYNWWLDQKIVVYIYTMEYDLAIRNNDMGFEGKWKQSKYVMLSEESQERKHKIPMFSLICGR